MSAAKALQAVNTIYLFLYNVTCMVGLSYVLYLSVMSMSVPLSKGITITTLQKSVVTIWKNTKAPLVWCQLAMCMEILHSLVGLVSLPTHWIILQVYYRIINIVVLQNLPILSKQWTSGIFLALWILTEVIRYTYNVYAKLRGPDNVPKFLFHLRYTLPLLTLPFTMVAEVLSIWPIFTILEKAPTIPFYGSRLNTLYAIQGTKAILFTYAVFGSYLYWSYVQLRRDAMKIRFRVPPPPDFGTSYPKDGSSAGTRSAEEVGKHVLLAALAGIDSEEAKKIANALENECNWKETFGKYFEAVVRVSASSKEGALGSAKAGMQWIYDNFEYVVDGKGMKFGDAMKISLTEGTTPFHVGYIEGEKKKGKMVKNKKTKEEELVEDQVPFYRLPYDGEGYWNSFEKKNRFFPAVVLINDKIPPQLEKWVKRGIMEQDAADAIDWTAKYFEDGDKDLSQTYFVVIGAGSAVGPMSYLLQYNGNVVAIDTPGRWGTHKNPTEWRKIIAQARNGRGTLTFPMDTPQEDCLDDIALCAAAGADLVTEPFELANWLVKWSKTIPKDATVVIGNYAYRSHGDQHVRLSLCADVLIQTMRKTRPATIVAFLGEPTDVYVVPEKASQAAKTAYGAGLRNFGFDMMVNLFSYGKYMNKNAVSPGKFLPSGGSLNDDEIRQTVHLINGLTLNNGPNHALAKHIQHWRSIIEYEAGATVSASVAPITGTVSALSKVSNNYSFGGLYHFGIEVFKQETTISMMTAILIHDVYNTKSPKNPKNRIKNHVRTGWDLFSIQAVHGGIWRSPYNAGSILGEFAMMAYFAVEGAIIGGMSLVLLIASIFFLQVTKDVGPKLPSGSQRKI